MQIIESKFLVTPEKGEVSAALLRPDSARVLLVLGHGAGAGMYHANMEAIAQALAAKDIATFRYQFPYMERGGKGRDGKLVSYTTVRKAIEAGQLAAPDLPIFAGGHSFGGRMTSHIAAENPPENLKGVIFFSFPLHAPGRPGIERAAHLADIQVPMLFLTGTRDTFVQLDLFEPLIASLGDLATLHLLDTGNHGYKILKRSRTVAVDIFTEMAEVAKKWVEDQGISFS
ncbi:MAG: alpha/beta fold hydrolase [Bacteroidota bacterium]